MSAAGKNEAPPYIVPGQDRRVKVYHVDTPFTPPESAHSQLPVFTGGLNSTPESDGKNKFVSYDTALGFHPGMATCTSCQQQVVTNVTYKVGQYTWFMFLTFICISLGICLFPIFVIPFFIKKFKDAHHTCPRCNKVLHIEKRK